MTTNSPGTNGRRGHRSGLSSVLGYFRSITQINSRIAQVNAKLDYLEHQTHGARSTYVGNNRVLVKAVVGRANIAYFVEADDLLLSPWFIISGTFETHVTDFFLRELRPDSHCLDLGSNFGFYTGLMGRFCPEGRVIAVEADAHVYPLVRDNIAINGFGHATALNAAVCDTEREVTLHRRGERSANTSIVPVDAAYARSVGESPPETFTVGGVTVDALADRMGGRVDFIKIDIEGSEPMAIAGAKRTLAANPQITVVMEWSPGQIEAAGFDLRAFCDDLAQAGLKPFDLVGESLQPLTYEALLGIPYRAAIILRHG